jgi:hypothetical protein
VPDHGDLEVGILIHHVRQLGDQIRGGRGQGALFVSRIPPLIATRPSSFKGCCYVVRRAVAI